jgi:hypothetical protein
VLRVDENLGKRMNVKKLHRKMTYEKNHLSSSITISIFSFLDIFGFLIRNNILCPTGTSKPFYVKDIEIEIKSTTANISFALISGDEYFNLSPLCLNFKKANQIRPMLFQQ